MSVISRCRRVKTWLASKRWFWALPGRAGGTVVETTVDHTLMRGSEPHDRWYVAELPQSRSLRRIVDPADSAPEVPPARDRAPSLPRKSFSDGPPAPPVNGIPLFFDQPGVTVPCRAMAQTNPASSRAIAVVTILAGFPARVSLR